METAKFLEIMDLAENLKKNTRHSWTSSGRRESVAEHSWRLALMACFVKDEFPEADMDKVMKMCLFHDMGEAFTGDIPAFLKKDSDEKAESAQITKWLKTLPEPYRRELTELFAEMEALESVEAKIYKALDKMEALIQHNEADISTWLPLEYELQMTYGTEEVRFSEYMQRLKRAVNQVSREKMESAENGSRTPGNGGDASENESENTGDGGAVPRKGSGADPGPEERIKEMANENQWLDWIIELQSLAQSGLYYGKDVYDRERYERIREIAALMMSRLSDQPLKTVRDLFCNETGYQTPKLDTRGAIFNDQGKILLVHEKNGTWSLPGGWVDVNTSIKENVEKEVWEEAGLLVTAERILAVEDRNKHNLPRYAYGVCKIFLLCSVQGGSFRENSETTETAYFSEEELPLLAEEKCNEEQIRMCFAAYRDENWKPFFD